MLLNSVATKPAVGLFDFASNVTEGKCEHCPALSIADACTLGIRNTTTVFDQKAIDGVRLPRLIPYDKVLRVR